MSATKTKHYKSDQHHIRRLHKLRVVWFAVLAVGIIGAQSVQLAKPQVAGGKVLAYATSTSISGLANATNQARAANGLGQLALNSQLNSGAQAKAQHMIANNYWSHTAPDGTEPWYFFEWAGYSYVHAGENLAYGFDGSGEIVDAWMGSTGHRANILGDYKDMGFGIANGANYQGGEYTVVVAFYGKAPNPPAPAPPPPAVQSNPAPTPAPAPVVAAEPEPTPEPEPAPQEEPKQEPEEQAEPVTTQADAPAAEPKKVTNLQNILSGNAGWPMYASLGFVGASMVGFFTTHVQLVRRGWRHARHFILVHPALDTALLVALLATLLTATVGFIR